MRRKQVMRYDACTDRWSVDLQGRRYGLRCGEALELYIGGEPIRCSVEADRHHWYVIVKDVRFYLRPADEYRVSLC